VIVVLVAHQRKIAEKGFRIDIQDVAGSLNISNKAYNVIAQYRVDMIPTDKKDYTRFKEDVTKSGFDLDDCDGVLEVLKTKGNGNTLVGLKYNAEQKTYSQAKKISKTKADQIFKALAKQTTFNDIDEVDEDKLPF
jgi:hypothetical protein